MLILDWCLIQSIIQLKVMEPGIGVCAALHCPMYSIYTAVSPLGYVDIVCCSHECVRSTKLCYFPCCNCSYSTRKILYTMCVGSVEREGVRHLVYISMWYWLAPGVECSHTFDTWDTGVGGTFPCLCGWAAVCIAFSSRLEFLGGGAFMLNFTVFGEPSSAACFSFTCILWGVTVYDVGHPLIVSRGLQIHHLQSRPVSATRPVHPVPTGHYLFRHLPV